MAKLLTSLVSLLLVTAACTAGEGTPPTPVIDEDVRGVLAGSVTIGPLCPIEPCGGSSGDIYSSRELVLQRPGGVLLNVSLRPDGTFEGVAPIGTYAIHLDRCEYLGCQSVFPVTVEIRDGETSTLNIDIDTGIRSAVEASEAYRLSEEAFKALLTIFDVEKLLTIAVRLNTDYTDFKAMAEGVDPAQVGNMDRWYGLVFQTEDRMKGMTFSAMDFDSEASAQGHFETIKAETPGIQDMDSPIGDASVEVEVNAQGIGSMLVFVKGDKLVMLHTAQRDDQEPLLSLEGLEELAQLVASRLTA